MKKRYVPGEPGIIPRKKYIDVKLHSIYALEIIIDDLPAYFVGITSSKDFKSIVRRHRRGEISVTARFTPDMIAKSPKFLLLYQTRCTRAEAYKYLLCFVRLLDENNYDVLTWLGTENQAADFFRATDKIYREICSSTNLEELLTNGIQPIEEKKKEMEEVDLPRTQMNIRVFKEDKFLFSNLCSKYHLSQHECFARLLSTSPLCEECEDTGTIDNRLNELKNEIKKKTQIIKEMQQQLSSPKRDVAADVRLKKHMECMQEVVNQYIYSILPIPRNAPLQPRPYYEGKWVHKEGRQYSYPEEDETTTIELHTILRSAEGKEPHFLFGRDVHSSRLLRIRYYTKKDFFGVEPIGNAFAYKNSHWLINYKITRQNVAELYAAFPIVSEQESISSNQGELLRNVHMPEDFIAEEWAVQYTDPRKGKENSERESLDDQIKQIELLRKL